MNKLLIIKLLFLFLCVFLLENVHAQKKKKGEEVVSEILLPPSLFEDYVAPLQQAKDTLVEEEIDNVIYVETDEKAHYDGAIKEFNREFQSQFPLENFAPQYDRFVIALQVVVEKDGELTDVVFYNDVNYHIKRETLRVLKRMAKWVPAKLNGKQVRSRVGLPIMFRRVIDKDFYVEAMDIPDAPVYIKYACYREGIHIFKERFISSYLEENNLVRGESKMSWGINFIVEPDGSLFDIKVINLNTQQRDNVAESCIRELGLWQAGSEIGYGVVRSNYNMTVEVE